MYKPFDAAAKQIIEADPVAWLRFLGLPGNAAELINADMTTVAEADRILCVTDPDYMAHTELQTTYEADMGDRMLLYNVVTYDKHRIRTVSAVLLLRKSADGPGMTGRVLRENLTFTYHVIRLWERSPQELLRGPVSLLPLVPLTKITKSALRNAVKQMERRIDTEVPAADRSMLWSTTMLLMGLKYDPEFSLQLLKGVMEMKESSTYQYILNEGRADEARRMFLRLGRKRLGEPDAETQAILDAITAIEQLEVLADRLFEVETWQELLN